MSLSDSEFIVAQYKVLAATMTVTDRTDRKSIANQLQRLARTDNPDLVGQINALERELSDLDIDIAHQETEINLLVYRLYKLTDAEQAHINPAGNGPNIPSRSSVPALSSPNHQRHAPCDRIADIRL